MCLLNNFRFNKGLLNQAERFSARLAKGMDGRCVLSRSLAKRELFYVLASLFSHFSVRVEREISVRYHLCEAPEGPVPGKWYRTLISSTMLTKF
jgi:hypothetical protein